MAKGTLDYMVGSPKRCPRWWCKREPEYIEQAEGTATAICPRGHQWPVHKLHWSHEDEKTFSKPHTA